jgi:hypothetical protein
MSFGMAERKAPSAGATWGLNLTRWGVPAALVVGGVVLVLVGGSAASGIGIVLIGAGPIVLALNLLLRLSFSDTNERDDEERARRYFTRHGRWPDDT